MIAQKEENIMKKLMVVITVAIVFSVSFLWVEGQQRSAGAKTAVTFWFPGGAAQEGYFLNAAKRFEAKNPDIRMEVSVLPPDAADIEARLNTAKLSDTFPDVFSAYLVFMGTRGARGDFAPLDDYIAKWDGKDDILKSALAMGRYQGKIIGLGFFPAPKLVPYRKDFFAEAGLDPERPPQNWEELAGYARKLVLRDEAGNVIRTGIDIPSQTPATVFIEPFMRQNGSLVIDEEKLEPSWTDEGAIEALEYIAGLWQEKLSIPHNLQQWLEHPFSKGNGSIGFLLASVLVNMFEEDPGLKEKVGYIPPMGPVHKVTFCGYRLFTIGAKSKVKDEAWRFIRFMMEKEEMWKRYEVLRIPPVRSSMQDRFIKDDPEFNRAVVEYIKYGKGKAVTPWTSIANKYLSQAYEEALNGVKSSQQALIDADKALRAELKRLGYL